MEVLGEDQVVMGGAGEEKLVGIGREFGVAPDGVLGWHIGGSDNGRRIYVKGVLS